MHDMLSTKGSGEFHPIGCRGLARDHINVPTVSQILQKKCQSMHLHHLSHLEVKSNIHTFSACKIFIDLPAIWLKVS
jgi:hypothetical protein